MNSKWINQNPKTLAIIFENGDEVVAGLKQLAAEYKLAASCFTAIGAFEEVTLGFFDLKKKNYKKIVFPRANGSAFAYRRHFPERCRTANSRSCGDGQIGCNNAGGHLIRGIVRPTLEVVLTESPAHLHRKYHSDFGLALINLENAS